MKTTTQLLVAVLFMLTPLLVDAQASMTGSNQASEEVSNYNPNPVVVEPMDFTSVAMYNRDEVLYDNGPFVTHPGAGPGGADRCELQNITLGMTTLGSNVSISANYRIADDFTVPASGWNIETFKFYGYQTNSTTTSTFDAVNLKIWDGDPADAGSNVVWGDGVTNLFLSSSWTNCYRDQENLVGNTARPIMEIVADVSGIFLPEGTYWVDYQLGGTLASGPWAPPITILGQTTTGNAMHFTPSGWIEWLMGGALTPQGALFGITGTVPAGASTITIGEGTTSQYQVPWNHYYQYSRTQTIYLQSEIGVPGAITKIAYNADTWPANYTYTQIQIWMGHTSLNVFGSAADWVDNASLTLVYDGPINIPGPGWFEIELDEPFIYDNTSNMIVSIYDPMNVPSYAGSTYRCFYSNPGGNRYLHAYSDTQVWPTNVLVSTMMPNIQLTLEELGDGFINGIVTDANTGDPIIGAHVMAGGEHYLTLGDGAYSFTLTAGTLDVTAMKDGYITQVVSITIEGGETVVQDFALVETANVPGPVLAELNGAATAVNLTWGLPQGHYEIIYDDGIADNVTAWGLAGNLNALRFTPAGYPAHVLGGSVNIFDGSYPEGDVLTPFQMAVYDATGANGYPGEELGVVDVTPDDFGWVNFDLSELDITIENGDFYLVMIQGGNFPNCAPIAVDETNPVMRSYSRFVTGGAPWTPAGFNDFMMRAVVQGPGGPDILAYGTGELVESARISEGAMFLNLPQHAIAEVGMGVFKPIDGTGVLDRNVEGYRVFRLVEGDEGDESLWTLLGNPSGTALVDNSWPSLPDGAYRWAVKAKYPMDNFSEPTFSNVLRKNWASDVTINVTLSDPNVDPLGVQVGLTNTIFPQYAYNGTTDADGVVNFPEVWKGNYQLVVYKFGYEPYEATLDIMTNTYSHDVLLLETAYPPSALYVDPVNIFATWVAPGVSLDLLEEDWSSGGFTANEWTFDPAQGNWQISASTGNPAPSARFYWSPSVTNYSNALVSKELSGLGMPNVMFSYDIFLSNFSSATLEEMTVEVWNGSSWVQVANYSNAGGNIAWTTHTHDITAHAQGQQFKVRFRAHGANSFNINWWDLDNIMVYGEVADGGSRGVLGYYVYLDDVLAGFTEETSFQYQPEYVNYGQTYTAGVRALYESGFSDMVTYVFTSEFLYPPCNLEGEDVGHAVELTWEAPGTCDPFGGGGGGGGGTGELYEIKYHNGVPGDAYYQQFNYGYGVVYNVAGYDNVTIEKVDYRHSPWGVFGTWDYKIHVVDWDTHTLLYTTSVLQSTVNDGWELDVPLNSIDGSGLVGIFLEPMGNVASDAYPCLDGDAMSTTSSFFGQLPNWSGMASAGVVGNFLMDLWIMADPMEGGERQLVKAPVLEGAAPIAGIETRINGDVPRTVPGEASGFEDADANAVAHQVEFSEEIWDVQIQYNLETITGALGNAGGETDGTHFYTTRWASNLIHKISMDGTLVEEFSIPGITGMRDLAYDGQYFYGSNATPGAGIRQLDFENKVLVSTIPCTFAVRSIAYDPVADGFWINNFGDDLKLISRTGALLQTINTAPLSLYGSAYDEWTAGGPYLWLFTGTTTGGGSQVEQLNLATGTLTGVSHSVSGNIPGNGIAGGLWTHPGIVPGTVTLGGVSQGTPDHLFGFELAPYSGGGGGGGPVETAGFRIYRDGNMIAEVDGETFSFVDDDGDYLLAGTYNYSITAIYDYEDELVESLHEGPISVEVAAGLGFVNGLIFDCVNFQPIGGATITAGEYSTMTQANGTFSLIAPEGVYDIHITAPFYFDLVVEDFEIVWQQTLTLNECLTPFQIHVDPTMINEVLPPGGQSSHTVVVTNNSDEELNWSVSINFLEETAIPQQDIKFEYVGPQTMTSIDNEYSPSVYNVSGEHTRALFDLLDYFPVGVGGGEYSVSTDGQFIYTAAWNSTNFYKYELDGTYLNSFTISGAGNIRDLTYDGEFFYGAPNSTTIYKMNFTTQTLAGTIPGPSAVRGIAYDAVNDGFWVTNGWDPPLRLISRTGAVLQTLNTTASSFSGLGWENVTPGGPYLWAYTQPASNNILVQINLTTGATVQTFDVSTVVSIAPGAISGGMDITSKLVPGKWVFLGTAQNDIIWVIELADAANWLTVSPTSGSLAAGASANVMFNFNTSELSIFDYKEAIVTVNSNPNVGSVPVEVSLLVEGTGPVISVDPAQMSAFVFPGGTQTQPLTINNTGDAALNWDAVVNLFDKVYEPTDYTRYAGDAQFESFVASPVNGDPVGFQTNENRDEVEIHYDTDWANNSVGTGGAVSFMCAARFTATELGNYYDDYELTKVRLHIAQASFSNVTVKVWEGGMMGDPGTEVYSRDVTAEVNVAAWTTIDLTAPITLEAGNEYWIGYAVDATGGHPASVDAGPMVVGKGAWMYFNGAWSQLTELAPTLNYNWCIRGIIAPLPTPWLSINPTSGQVNAGGSGTINVLFDATNLDDGLYTGEIVINSDDVSNPTVVVPVLFDVGVGIDEIEKITVMVYPVPASDLLHVAISEGINRIRMFSYTGQIVLDRAVAGEQTMPIDVKPYHSGAYILQFVTIDGRTMNRRIIISR
jgi:hypothetical protein